MSRRLRILAVVVVASLVLAAVAAWLALPRLAHWALVRHVEASTGRPVAIEQFHLDLWRGVLQVGGLRLSDREPGPPLAELERLDVRFAPGTLLRGRVDVQDAVIEGPVVRLVRDERGELNVADLLGGTTSAGPVAVRIDRLALRRGTLTFEDRSLRRARTWRAEDIEVTASQLSTLDPEPRGSGRLTARVAGAPLALDVDALRLAPFHARGRLAMQGVDARIVRLYLPRRLPIVLDRALLTAALDGTVDADRGLVVTGQARLDDVRLRQRRTDVPFLTLPSLEISIAATEVADDAPRVGRLEARGTATFHDNRTTPATPYPIDRLRLVVEDLDASGARPARVSLTAGLPGGGDLSARGTARLSPLDAEIRARLQRLDLRLVNSLLNVPARVAGSAESDLVVTVSRGDAVAVRVRGTATARRLALLDGDRAVGSVRQVEITGLDAVWPRLGAARVRVVGPSVTVARDRDGRFPIAALFTPPPEAAEAPETAPPPASPRGRRGARSPDAARPEPRWTAPRPDPREPALSRPASPPPADAGSAPAVAIEVAEVAVEDGALAFEDAAVTPAARLRMSPLRLTARDVTWPALRPVKVALAAAAPGAGTVSAEGTVALDPLRADLRARVAGAVLGPYRAYSPFPARIRGRADADVAVAAALGERVELRVTGTAALTRLTVADGDRRVLSVERLETTGLDYTWPATARIERLRVRGSWAMLERRADGSFPLAALFTPRRSEPKTAPPAGASVPGANPPAAVADTPAADARDDTAGQPAPAAVDIAVRESVLEGGSATVVDATVRPAARFELANTRLVARDLTWPARGPVPFRLSLPAPGGGTVSAEGELALAAWRLTAKVVLNGVDLDVARPYVPVRARVGGKASGTLEVDAGFDPLAITARGSAALADLALADGDRPLLTVERLEATDLDYRWPASLAIDQLRVRTSWAWLERFPDGRFSMRELFAARPVAAGASGPAASTTAPAPDTPGAAGADPAGAPTQVRVRRAVLEDGSATIVDGAVSPAARIDVAGARLVVRDFAWPAAGPIGLRLQMPTPGGGNLDARGQLRLDTQDIDTTLRLSAVDIGPAREYLGMRATLAGTAGGTLRVRGRLDPLALAVTGDLAVAGAALGDGQRTLVSAKRVELGGVNVDWPRRVSIARLGLREPWSLVERDRDGNLPLLSLLAPGGAPAPAAKPGGNPAPPAAAGAWPVVEIGALSVENGFVRVVDATVSPRFVEEMSAIAVTAQRLGTAPSTRSPVALSARLSGGAPLEITGVVGPLTGPLALDLRGKLVDLALPRINPYLNGLVGWIARRGALSATVHYQVAGGRLDARNDITIGQPEFAPSRRGDAVRERVGVPLGTLVALLKNTRGEVHLSVPVKGNLATREFDLGEAVWDAVRQAAIGALALPVSWVGKIFYTEDARIDTIRIWPISFEPGTTQLRRDIAAHAERLARFLREDTGALLTMKPVVALQDVEALRRDLAGRPNPRGHELAPAGEARPGSSGACCAPGGRPNSAPGADPALDAAVAELAARRLAATRTLLAERGVDVSRLLSSEGPVPVEASGPGRVEFEITP